VLQQANTRFPLLWAHARAPQSSVNLNYLNFSAKESRDREQYVFFEASARRTIALPSALTAAAGCEAIGRLIWQKAPAAAGDIVGNTLEKSVFIACRAHTADVCEKVTYQVNGADLEIDIAARDGQELVLFECKTKALTREARTGDWIAFIQDYTKSFLALLRQLVRHDQNIKRGLTPLTQDNDDSNTLQITKIAVSPLSYGPVSDHFLTNSLMHSIAQIRLNSVDGNPWHNKILKEFNKSVQASIRIIDQIAPRHHDKVDMAQYLMQVSWLDFGQLLYALHRGRSLTDALSALRHVTYSTQDFWTEAAHADRQGLTKSKWHPIS
jgi:hypothetical protein